LLLCPPFAPRGRRVNTWTGRGALFLAPAKFLAPAAAEAEELVVRVSVATSRIANNLAQMLALLPVVLLTKDVRSRTPAPTCRISDTCLQVLHLQHVPLSPGRPGAPRSPRSQRGAIDNPTRPTNGRQRG